MITQYNKLKQQIASYAKKEYYNKNKKKYQQYYKEYNKTYKEKISAHKHAYY